MNVGVDVPGDPIKLNTQLTKIKNTQTIKTTNINVLIYASKTF